MRYSQQFTKLFIECDHCPAVYEFAETYPADTDLLRVVLVLPEGWRTVGVTALHFLCPQCAAAELTTTEDGE